MTLDDLNLPEEETAGTSAPVFTLDALEDAKPAEPEMPVVDPEMSADAVPATEPIPEPVVHTPPQPAYPSAPVAAPVAEPMQPAATNKPPKAPKPRRRKPHIALRIPMQLLSFVLAVVLFAVLICGVLLADLRQITSEGGIKQIVNALLMPTASAPVTVHPAPIQVDLMSNEEQSSTEGTLPGDITVDENGNISIGGDITIDPSDIPDDILTGGGSEANVGNLVDWIYEQIDESTDKPLKYTKEEMRAFVQESTVADYLSEKLAGYADDFINNTENTEITSREIMKLLKENEYLMKSKLNMELTDEQWDQIEKTVDEIVEKNDINATIRDTVYTAVDTALEETAPILGDVKREDLQATLQLLTSDSLFIGFAGAAVLLLLLLCLLNYYNVPAGLTWAAIPAMIAGTILSLPVLALQTATDVVMDLLPELNSIIGVLASFIGVFAPIHYGLLIIGFSLLIVSIVWRVVRAVVR